MSNLFGVITIITCLSFSIVPISSDPDDFVETPLLIRSKGYPAEEHQVITDDGS